MGEHKDESAGLKWGNCDLLTAAERDIKSVNATREQVNHLANCCLGQSPRRTTRASFERPAKELRKPLSRCVECGTRRSVLRWGNQLAETQARERRITGRVYSLALDLFDQVSDRVSHLLRPNLMRCSPSR